LPHHVLNSLATFEETPPTLEEMLSRRIAWVELGLPYLVAEARGETVGFAYAAAYRARPAYRYTIEIRSMSPTASAAAASAPRRSAN